MGREKNERKDERIGSCDSKLIIVCTFKFEVSTGWTSLVLRLSDNYELGQRRLVTLLHARRCANHAIHDRFNPVLPAESADLILRIRAKLYVRTDVIRNVSSIINESRYVQ